MTPNPFGTTPRVLRRRHRRRDHRPPRRHLRLARAAPPRTRGASATSRSRPRPTPVPATCSARSRRPRRAKRPRRPRRRCAQPRSAGRLPLTPGQQAKILPSGLAAAPSDAPPAVKLAIAAGNQLDLKALHLRRRTRRPAQPARLRLRLLGRDQLHPARRRRARAVRRGLHAARELRPAGPGAWITVYANSGHAFIAVAGIVMNTAWYAPVNPTVPDSGPALAARVHDHSPSTRATSTAASSNATPRASDDAPPARQLPSCSRRSPRPRSPAAGSPTRTRARTPPRRPSTSTSAAARHQRRPRTRAWRHDPRRRARRAVAPLRPAPHGATPQAALERYAHLYVNWTADSVAAVQRELASLSEGQARAQALQAAASYTRDQTLTQSGVANSGHLVAITPSLTTPEQWVLVTSEQTTGKGDYSGLPPTAACHLRASHSDPERLGRERMGAAELTRSRTSLHGAEFSRRLQSRTTTPAIWIVLAYAVLWTITLLGAVIGTIAPQLAPAGRPHPTLHGSIGDMASIAGTNARVLSAPFLLSFFRFPAHRRIPTARRSADRRDPRCQRAARRTRTRPLARSPPPLRTAAAARMAGRRPRRGSLADPQEQPPNADGAGLPRRRPRRRRRGRGGRDDRDPARPHSRPQRHGGFCDHDASFTWPSL